jgi:crotonobetainyl-CoA:carnitine CoA-transferase CaiB-like acyl-CoA transferase
MHELLDGITIVDLTGIYLGPYATRLLGDFGADVIKVESLDGDVGRSPGPGRSPEMGAGFVNTNRNKRSLAIDLKRAQGREVVLRLAARADAFVHNVRPKAAGRLCLAYEEVKRVNPAIVYCFAPGFGQDGPYADNPAYDDIMQAISGLASLNADTGGAPRFVPSIVVDKVVGLHLAFAIASGLVRRMRTGEGCEIEVPMFESMVAFLMLEHLAGESFVPPLGPPGYERMLAKNRRPYRTRDGYIAIMPYTTLQWTRFLECVGRSDLLTQDWVSDPVKRSAHVEALYQIIAEAAPARTTAEWLEALAQFDVPCGPANGLADLFAEPHLKAVGLFEAYDHPTEGLMRQVRSPFRVHPVAARTDAPAPELGNATLAVLDEAGYSAEEIKALVDAGVVRAPNG